MQSFPKITKGHTMLVDTLCQKISRHLDSMSNREAVIGYLDHLESQIVEIPYGDVLYEHAYEYAQAIILPKFARETVSRRFLKTRGV